MMLEDDQAVISMLVPKARHTSVLTATENGLASVPRHR